MNKLPIFKLSAVIYMVVAAFSAQAQDSVPAKPAHTVTNKTMVVNPKLQKSVTGQPVMQQPHTTATGFHHAPGPVRPVTGGAAQPAAGTTRPATPYRQPAATYHPPVPYTAAQPMANITDKSLNGQYQYLLTRVYGYQRPMVAAFYKNVVDSMAVNKRKVRELQATLASQTKAVKDLQTDMNSKKEILDASESKADSISLLGIDMSKSTYNTIMWGLVILFGAAAAIVIVQSGSNRREAKYRTKLYDDLDNEYKTYKSKANEKEKKLARELQTVRNKLEEITGNPEY